MVVPLTFENIPTNEDSWQEVMRTTYKSDNLSQSCFRRCSLTSLLWLTPQDAPAKTSD